MGMSKGRSPADQGSTLQSQTPQSQILQQEEHQEVSEEDDGKCLGFTQFGRGFPGSLKQKGIHLPKRISAR